MARPLLFALVLVTVSGCAGYEMSDDVDFTWDFFDPLHTDDLHSPYVPGATVRIFADPYNGAPDDRATWSWESSDPSVARIVSDENGSASVEMVGPGLADIILRGGDDDELRSTARIEVGAPVEAELMWHGELLLGHSEDDARVDDARVLVGETGAFLVRFLDERGRLLSGNGALRVDASPEAGAGTERTFLLERRDWLMVTPSELGPHEVNLSAGTTHVDAFLVTGVDAAEVANVVIEGQSEANRDDGASLVMVAHAEDAEGRSILGIDYAWEIDGDGVAGFGDVLRYTFDRDFPVMVGATFGSEHAEAMIHSSGGFMVSDSAHVGCSAGGAEAVEATVPLALLSLVLTWRHGRRRHHPIEPR